MRQKDNWYPQPPFKTTPKPEIPVKMSFPYPPRPCITSGYTSWMNTSSPNSYGERGINKDEEQGVVEREGAEVE